MERTGLPHTSSPGKGGEGVRVSRNPHASRRVAMLYLLCALLVLASAIGYLLGARGEAGDPPGATPVSSDPAAPAAARANESRAGSERRVTAARRIAPIAAAAPEEPYEMPSQDPDDIASHIRPGDPEPTGAELIEALHHAGIRSGIGAFNPPGTSPLLAGLVVPEDYVLPEGFVRHHQVTDEGEPLEAILLFSPDYQFFDADGQPIAIPENRVVPPELAPPDLPIRPVEPPSP